LEAEAVSVNKDLSLGVSNEVLQINLRSMTEEHNKETSRYNMSRIKATDTKPEMLVRRFLQYS
jgi:hypothetical protein